MVRRAAAHGRRPGPGGLAPARDLPRRLPPSQASYVVQAPDDPVPLAGLSVLGRRRHTKLAERSERGGRECAAALWKKKRTRIPATKMGKELSMKAAPTSVLTAVTVVQTTATRPAAIRPICLE